MKITIIDHTRYGVNKENQRGNILFLILIAVALFAALSYAVTKSTRSGSGDVSRETRSLQISDIVQYVIAIRSAIVRMRIGGCSDEDVSFYFPPYAETNQYEHTPEQPDRCKIFHPGGGGVPYRQAESFGNVNDGTQWLFTGTNRVMGIGSAETELVLMIPRLTLEACMELNRQFSVTAAGVIPPEEGSSFGIEVFDGDYETSSIGNLDNIGQSHESCFNITNIASLPDNASWLSSGAFGDEYWFTAVLIGR